MTEDLYIVGIGASAGGLEALEALFTTMPSHDDIAFVIVQHLSPDYKSHMVQLLSKYTEIPVQQAQDGMIVQGANIYVLPPGKNMIIGDGKLFLMDYVRERGLSFPIDMFLETLAKDQQEKAIAIILSGTGSDGTRGVRAIKEAGGFVLVQDETAKFDGMPRSAIGTQIVDVVNSPESFSEHIVNYIVLPTLHSQPDNEIEAQENDIEKLLQTINDITGINFAGYKRSTLFRRIERRMGVNQIDTLGAYVQYLRRSPDECRILNKEFLISVTRFFRDPEAFEYLSSEIIPKLFEDKRRNDQIRVWVSACATGEEAYSLAILFREHMEKTGKFTDVKIFATDIDRDALDFAAQGLYLESIVADVSVPRLHKFFTKQGDSYQITRQIRNMVVFAYQNLVQDPPFSRIDLVSCRNVLIYLQTALQSHAISMFEFSLKPQGFLFLGNSETVGEHSANFSLEHNKWKLYRNYGTARPALKLSNLNNNENQSHNRDLSFSRRRKTSWHSTDEVLRSLVEQQIPPCIIVDDSEVVIHAFGDVRQYLQAPVGFQVSLKVTNMVSERLSIPLNTALRHTIQSGEKVNYHNIAIAGEAEDIFINLTTEILRQSNNRPNLYIITIERSEPVLQETKETFFDLNESAEKRIQDLERELQHTRENLQATIEELETTNEEMQATNEELLTANEELQSTNEELQSVNEELMTVNSEYQAKIRELTALNNDINNLIRVSNVGTIFLDQHLYLRRFTPAIQQVVNIIEQDVGRPFSHISYQLLGIDLIKVASEVLATLATVSLEAGTADGRWYLIDALPYLTQANQVDGVVISITNITQTREASEIIRRNEQLYRTIVSTIPFTGVWVFDKEMRYRLAEGEEAHFQGLQGDTVEGKYPKDVYPPETVEMVTGFYQKVLDGDVVQSFRHETKNNDAYNMRIVPTYDENQEVDGGIVIAQNLGKIQSYIEEQ